MKRKQFLSSLAVSAAGIPLFAAHHEDPDRAGGIIPPYLKPGDTIGLTSPAGYIMPEEIQPAVLQMESWGLKIKTGETIGKRNFSFGGTDEERTADLQQML